MQKRRRYARLVAAACLVSGVTVQADENLLVNADFAVQQPVDAAFSAAMADVQVDLRSPQFPIFWRLNTGGKPCPGGRLDYRQDPTATGAMRQVVALAASSGHAELYQTRMIELASLPAGAYYVLRVTARGKGTVALRLLHYGADFRERGTGAFVGACEHGRLPLTAEWQVLAGRPTKLQIAAAAAVSVAVQVEGEAELAEVMFTATQPVAEVPLRFHLPFENTLQAAVARGTPVPYEAARAHDYVDGVCGRAARFTRAPQRNPVTRQCQYAIGPSYFSRENLPAGDGTIELWFRPLPEMLTWPAWTEFYLFSLAKAHGPSVHLSRSPETAELTLVLSEKVLSFTYPGGERHAETTAKSLPLPDADFIDRWHHLALTWTDATRRLFLDGRPVIEMDAPKQPCIVGDELDVGWAGRWAPYVPSADLDEFKIYDGVRYLDAFEPERPTPPAPPAAEQSPAATIVHPLRADAAMTVAGDHLAVPLLAGNQRYLLQVAIGDGLPSVLTGSGEDDALPLIAPTQVTDGWRAQTSRYKLTVELTIRTVADRQQLVLTLTNNDPQWRALLAPRLSLQQSGAGSWRQAFVGTADRQLPVPFVPFAATGIANNFPLTAAWNSASGIAMALTPETIVSWTEQGLPQPDRLQCGVRCVLDPGREMRLTYDLFTFDPRYGSDDAIARYHHRYPRFFARDPGVDAKVYSATALGIPASIWRTGAYAEKVETFSAQELSRRANAGWCWYYHSGSSAGNWSYDDFLLRSLPQNTGKFGGLPAAAERRQARASRFQGIRDQGIGVGFYVLPSWIEQRYARYFADSLFGPFATVDGSAYLDNWWTGGMRDYAILCSGTRFADLLRRQITEILAENPAVTHLCLDVAERDDRFRGDARTLGPVQAYDEQGVFVSNIAAVGALCAFIREQRTATGGVPGICGNTHVWQTGFPVLFRMDTTIFEGRMFELIGNDYRLRQAARFAGSRPTCLYLSANSDLLGNYYPELDKWTPEQLQLEIVRLRMQTFLSGFTNNLYSCPDNVFGVAEIAAAQADLAEVIEAGYRFVSAATITPPLRVARYGNGARGFYPVVNLDDSEHTGELRLDTDYLTVVPLLAADEPVASRYASGTVAADVTVAGLDYRLLRVAAGLRAPADFICRGTWQGDRDGWQATISVVAGSGTAELLTQLQPFEVLVNQLPARIALAPGSEIEIAVKDRRWTASCSQVRQFPFVTEAGAHADLIHTSPAAAVQARRIAEYFRFWTANQSGWETAYLRLLTDPAEAGAARVVLRTAAAAEPQIERPDESVLTLTATAADLEALVDELLRALDRQYPYAGRLGSQYVSIGYGDASTPEMKALLQRAGAAGNTFSCRRLLQALQRRAPGAADHQ